MEALFLVILGLAGYRHMAYRPWSVRARAPAFLPTPGPLRSRAPRQHAPAEQAAGLSYMKAGQSPSRPRGEKGDPQDRVTQLLTTQECLRLVPRATDDLWKHSVSTLLTSP